MTAKDAVIAYCQAEKIKSGIIWVSHAIEMLKGFHPQDLQGAEMIIKTIVNLVVHEVHLAKTLLRDNVWEDVAKKMDVAIVMINSGVTYESSHHLTQALSQVTSVCQRAMTELRAEDLI